MTPRQIVAYARLRRALHVKRVCCGGQCSTSQEAIAASLCPCGCGRTPEQHIEMRSAA